MGKATRFQRNPETVGIVKIQPRDIEIINLVWRYRFLTSEQVQALVEGSDQVILRRLQNIYSAGC
jgi:hypothetical protein